MKTASDSLGVMSDPVGTIRVYKDTGGNYVTEFEWNGKESSTSFSSETYTTAEEAIQEVVTRYRGEW